MLSQHTLTKVFEDCVTVDEDSMFQHYLCPVTGESLCIFVLFHLKNDLIDGKDAEFKAGSIRLIYFWFIPPDKLRKKLWWRAWSVAKGSQDYILEQQTVLSSKGKQLLRLKLPTVAYYCWIKLTVKSHLLFSLKIHVDRTFSCPFIITRFFCFSFFLNVKYLLKVYFLGL